MAEEKELWAKFERRMREKLREHQRAGKGPNDPLFVTGYPQGSGVITQRSALYDQILKRLFEAAKLTDEFEYACSLLNIEGMKSNGWSPEEESWTLINEVASYSHLPTAVHSKIRLGLLQYSHIGEMELTYSIVMNMLRVVSGGGATPLVRS